MKRLALVLLLCVGCAHYKHSETYFVDGELQTWKTSVWRTWGTTDLEWANTAERGKGSIRGDGMSDNLQKTMGDDVVEVMAEQVRKGLVPTSALGDVLGGSDEVEPEADTD